MSDTEPQVHSHTESADYIFNISNEIAGPSASLVS